jgi:pectin methylesterase-like acyl-CoA thioesterase
MIHVWNGTYTENVIVNKSLTLAGEGRDVVTMQAASAAEHVFNVTADYVNIMDVRLLLSRIFNPAV